MLNEKGLVVSSILYTLLIAFLLFLGVTLSTFQASSRLISNSNKDLINGTKLTATAIALDDVCDGVRKWYQNDDGAGNNIGNQYLIKINSRYGTSYWPRDYGLKDTDANGNFDIAPPSSYVGWKGKIKVICSTEDYPGGVNIDVEQDCSNLRLTDTNISKIKLKISDGVSDDEEVTLSNFCPS